MRYAVLAWSTLSIFLVAACSSTGTPTAIPTGTAQSTPAERPTRPEEPTPTPAAQPSATAAGTPAAGQPSLAFIWPDGEDPVVTTSATGIDERYVNPGAVIEHDGRLYMYANVFTAWPGRVQVARLESNDGVAWAAETAPVLTSDDVPFAQPGIDVSTGFIAADGTWVLVFQSVNQLSPWALGIATADGPDGPWDISPEPVLAGEEGSWDAGGLAWPSVVPTDDGWAMYYSAFAGPGAAKAIGMATSADGRSWTKRDAPVFEGNASSWELGSVDRPRVVATPAGFLMVYAGRNLTDRGVAWSTDGITWQRDGGQPVMTRDDFPVAGEAWDAALLVRDETAVYYLEIGLATESGGTAVYRATAALPSR